MSSAQPTEQDHANAARRQAIADKFRSEFEDARTLVCSVLGPGWRPLGRHYLVSHDEEERVRASGGKMDPAATVYSAEEWGSRRHVLVIGDERREVEGYEHGFGPMLTEPDPVRTFEHNGERVAVHKYSLYWAGFDTSYRPRTAKQLATARVRREEKAVEREAEANPPFADFIREEHRKPRTRG
jgi:hypothetical protein